MNTPETDELIRRYADKIRYELDDHQIKTEILIETDNDTEKAFLILTAARLLAKN